ncbi:MAG TPA: thioesterase family protein [Smithella sp.]|nr:thioesterase family protein [Smithella sp.]MDM7988473.1 thioesterase family protein [Smithella sp.]HNY50372.1 thioesterase family protein [Smithella sp.]HOG88969.1 thioesterase family protein [Smithella sp.]HOU51530.1 thioesterase family protein [Smithella sp.]
MDSLPTEVILDNLKNIYEEMMPFNKYLGLKIDSISKEGVVVRIDMRDELVGNFEKKILHGGVISTILDFTGGVIAQIHVIKEMQDASLDKIVKRLTSMGTIDMRVDYMRPGKGSHFLATGHILRLGHKVAVARTEFVNEAGVLIAVGTSTYIVG